MSKSMLRKERIDDTSANAKVDPRYETATVVTSVEVVAEVVPAPVGVDEERPNQG
jgi:hypothetical protein